MIKKIIFISILPIIVLISFEIFLRYSPYMYGTSPVIYDKDIGMWHKSNYSGYTVQDCYKNRYIFNKLGLPKNIYKYDTNKKDVILLGDSFVEALMIKNRNIIHNSLAKEFNHKYNFLNYGLFGTTTIQHAMILKDKVNLNRVKYILHFVNIEDDLFEIKTQNSTTLSRPKINIKFKTLNNYTIIYPREKRFYDTVSDILGNYQLYTFSKKSIRYLLDFIKNSNKNIDVNSSESIEDFTKEWLSLKGGIYLINKYAKSHKIKYRVIVSSTNRKNKNIIKDFLNREKIKYIFLDEAAKKMNIKITLYNCDNHWDDKAHQQIAKIVKKFKLIE